MAPSERWPLRGVSCRAAARIEAIPGARDSEVISALFVPEASTRTDPATGVHLVDAREVMTALR
ncbi:MAG: hypothetical protein OXS33_12420 [bacterium]|nr:hypothetical protein [bacterium]